MLQARRWLPERDLVLVGDSGFAALELLDAPGRQGIVCITRLPNLSDILAGTSTGWQRVALPGWYGEGERIVELCSANAVRRHAGRPVVPIRWVLVRDPLGRFEPQALLCTGLACAPEQILHWFVRRWQIEVTFQETRAHPGVETQRQRSDRSIARTTPCLLGRASVVTLLADRLESAERRCAATTAWYHKQHPTFSDTLAAVRRPIRQEQGLLTSRRQNYGIKPCPALQRAMADVLGHAARWPKSNLESPV